MLKTYETKKTFIICNENKHTLAKVMRVDFDLVQQAFQRILAKSYTNQGYTEKDLNSYVLQYWSIIKTSIETEIDDVVVNYITACITMAIKSLSDYKINNVVEYEIDRDKYFVLSKYDEGNSILQRDFQNIAKKITQCETKILELFFKNQHEEEISSCETSCLSAC